MGCGTSKQPQIFTKHTITWDERSDHDNVYSIASRYGMHIEELYSYNRTRVKCCHNKGAGS